MNRFLGLCVLLMLLYIAFSTVVWRFRHPWATDIECFLHIYDAMTFHQVPYDEMRPR